MCVTSGHHIEESSVMAVTNSEYAHIFQYKEKAINYNSKSIILGIDDVKTKLKRKEVTSKKVSKWKGKTVVLKHE